MYLRKIRLLNTGPIPSIEWTLPFEGDRPKPLLLVGPNGSGKSTVTSFIVNALVAMKQCVFDNTEIESGKVFRIRYPLGIHNNCDYYFARLSFDKGLSLVEWQLARHKSSNSQSDAMEKIDATWSSIPTEETNYFALERGDLGAKTAMTTMINSNSFLYYGADRFEPPDWLNADSLMEDLKLPEPIKLRDRTSRRIFARSRLKPTLDWLTSIIFDMMVTEHSNVNIPLKLPDGTNQSFIKARIAVPSRAHAVFEALNTILSAIICRDEADTLSIHIGQRNARILSASIQRNGQTIRSIKNLLSLSAGESALFCLFAGILLDADLSSASFAKPSDITGIVVIDEADLHLHVDLQYNALPKLMSLFPKIQFVATAHAPLFILGLEKHLSADGFDVRELPSGVQISPEHYTEFHFAFAAMSGTRKFRAEIADRVSNSPLPVVLLEGKSDAELLRIAWNKLHGDKPRPFDFIPCGIEPEINDRNGGADMLRRCIEFLPLVSDRCACAIFDFDRKGYESFNGISSKSFSKGTDAQHRKHLTKDFHAITLPIPSGRDNFANLEKPIHSFLSIEHFFPDTILEQHGFSLHPVLPGSDVFEIDATPSQKRRFTDAAKNFPVDAYIEFKRIFDRLKDIGIEEAFRSTPP